jgi:hypothetical protein
MESSEAGTTEGSLKQEPPAKWIRLSKEEQPLHRLKNENARLPDGERDGQASLESLEWERECIVELATDVCCVKEEGREECRRFHAAHVPELLNRYRTAMQQYVPSHLTRYSLLTMSTQRLRKGTARNFA